jgi:hypothetical protein
MDKEFLRRYRELRGEGMSKAEAQVGAEADDSLDRFLAVSPLLPMAAVRADANRLRSGEVIGYFAVPSFGDGPVIVESIADLTYTTTIDRRAVFTRIAVLSEEARTALRYALARRDALRTPKLGFELEAVDKRVRRVYKSDDDGALLTLELSDGSKLELLIPPEVPGAAGAARKGSPPAA